MPEQNLDLDLVRLLRDGDHKAFEELFNRYHEKLYYFAIRYFRNQDDAEELVQDVFVKLWENRESLKEQLSFSGYLFTIGRNTIFNRFRKRVNENAYREYLATYFDSYTTRTEDNLIYEDLKKLVDSVVEELPPQRQLVYKMSRDKGMSYREIAEELGLSERTVEAHIRLALQSISGVIDKELVIPFLLFAFSATLL